MPDSYLSIDDHNFRYLFGGAQGEGILVPDLPCDKPSGTSVLIEGHTGTGKTILACQLSWPVSYV